MYITNYEMNITTTQFRTLEDLFYFYNQNIFNGELPDCLVCLASHRKAHGYFWAKRWKSTDNNVIHEIALNPDSMDRPDIKWHSTLVHEMVHLWEEAGGKKSRYGYHNKKWAKKMEEIGLMPSDTAEPGGKKTGQRVSHYVIPGGSFEIAFNEISENDKKSLKLQYVPNSTYIETVSFGGEEGEDGEEGQEPVEKVRKSGVKIKYTCSTCEINIWGKSGLNIFCGTCSEQFAEL